MLSLPRWSFVPLACDRSQIISPALYGFVYFNTVASFPQAIMVVSMSTTLLALAFLSFVRIAPKPDGDRVAPGNEEGRSQVMAAPEILLLLESEDVEG